MNKKEETKMTNYERIKKEYNIKNHTDLCNICSNDICVCRDCRGNIKSSSWDYECECAFDETNTTCYSFELKEK